MVWAIGLSLASAIYCAETPQSVAHDPRATLLERWKDVDLKSREAADLVPGLLEIVRDKQAHWTQRRLAALTLGRIGDPARAALPFLIASAERALTAGADAPLDPAGRNDERTIDEPLWAITALARFGPTAAEAAPLLVQVMDDSGCDLILRLASIEALARIGVAHPLVLPALVRRLSTPASDAAPGTLRFRHELELQIAAAETFSLLRSAGAVGVPALMRATESPVERLRHVSVVSLGTIGPAADVAALLLAQLSIRDESLLVRDAAAASLAQVASVELVARMLHSPSVGVRERTAIGCRAGSTRTLLDAVLASVVDPAEVPAVQLAAAESAWELGRKLAGQPGPSAPQGAAAEAADPPAAPDQPDPRAREPGPTGTGELQRSLGPGRTVLPPLAVRQVALTGVAALSASERNHRIRGYRLLIKLGSSARVVEPELQRLATHADSQVRRAATGVLDLWRMRTP